MPWQVIWYRATFANESNYLQNSWTFHVHGSFRFYSTHLQCYICGLILEAFVGPLIFFRESMDMFVFVQLVFLKCFYRLSNPYTFLELQGKGTVHKTLRIRLNCCVRLCCINWTSCVGQFSLLISDFVLIKSAASSWRWKMTALTVSMRR